MVNKLDVHAAVVKLQPAVEVGAAFRFGVAAQLIVEPVVAKREADFFLYNDARINSVDVVRITPVKGDLVIDSQLRPEEPGLHNSDRILAELCLAVFFLRQLLFFMACRTGFFLCGERSKAGKRKRYVKQKFQDRL